MIELPKIRFVQARNCTPGGNSRIDRLVIHTMESPEGPTTALDVAHWFAGPTAPQASAHYCIDDHEIVQCVRDGDIAWHAPPNHYSLGIEHAGRASQTRVQWADPYSTGMLELSALLAAAKCRQHGIPVRWLTPQDLLAGRRGITSHVNVSTAWHLSDHTDPGPNFPLDAYLALVQQELGLAGRAVIAAKKTAKRTAATPAGADPQLAAIASGAIAKQTSMKGASK